MRQLRPFCAWLASVAGLTAADPATLAELEPVLLSPEWRQAEDDVRRMAAQGQGEAHYWLSLMALARGEGESAVKEGKAAVATDANNVHFQTALGYAYLERLDEVVMGKLEMAKGLRDAFEQTLVVDPTNRDALRALSQFYRLAPGIAGGNDEKADLYLARLRTVSPAEADLMQGLTALEKKQYPEARRLINQALAQVPELPLALYQSGRLSALSGLDPELGQAHLERYLALQVPISLMMPSEGYAHWRLAQIHILAGRHEEARTHLQEARRLEPDLDEMIEKQLKKLKA